MDNPKKHLILLPGTLCNEKLWAHQVKHLSQEYEVTVGDLTKDSTISGMAERVLNEASEKFILAGLSLGGIVALEVMKQQNNRVEKLILLDTNPHSPTKEQIETWHFFKELSHQGDFTKVTKEYLLPNLLAPENSNDANKQLVIEMSDDIGESAMFNQLTALESRLDNTDILDKINIPVLIIVGEKDVVCPVEMSEEMTSKIPDAKIKIIAGSGHLSSLEKPQAVTNEIYKFL